MDDRGSEGVMGDGLPTGRVKQKCVKLDNTPNEQHINRWSNLKKLKFSTVNTTKYLTGDFNRNVVLVSIFNEVSND